MTIFIWYLKNLFFNICNTILQKKMKDKIFSRGILDIN